MVERRDGDHREHGVLESLADADCRAILRATHLPRTAPEISDLCEIPLSTVYRKVDRLTDLSLLETRIRIDSDGRHPTQYERRIDGLLIQLGPRDELGVSVYRTAKPGGDGDAGSERPLELSGEGENGERARSTDDDRGQTRAHMPVEVQFVDAPDDREDTGEESAASDGSS